MQEQQWLAVALLVIRHAGGPNRQEALFGRKVIEAHGASLSDGLSVAPVATGQAPGFLQQAHPQVQKARHAGIGNAVVESRAVAAGSDDASIRQALQLIRHRLRAKTEL